MGSKKWSAWLPTNESGFTDSRKKIAGTVIRWRTVSSASLSRSASSSGVREGMGAARPGLSSRAGPSSLQDHGELRFHKRHDLISIPSERKPDSPVGLQPVSFLERTQEDAVRIHERAAHLPPGPRPGDPQRLHLDPV